MILHVCGDVTSKRTDGIRRVVEDGSVFEWVIPDPLYLQYLHHVREYKTVLDSGFDALGFRILLQNFPGFQIPQAKIYRIPESEFSYMGFQ